MSKNRKWGSTEDEAYQLGYSIHHARSDQQLLIVFLLCVNNDTFLKLPILAQVGYMNLPICYTLIVAVKFCKIHLQFTSLFFLGVQKPLVTLTNSSPIMQKLLFLNYD